MGEKLTKRQTRRENARFLVAEFLYYDFELFGTQDSLLQTSFEELENNVWEGDEKLDFRCGTIEVSYKKCIPVYAFHSGSSGALEFRNCPPGTKEVTVTLTAHIPCNTPDLSFPIDHSTVFKGGETDWWSAAGGGSHGGNTVLPIPISNPTLNSLGIQTLDAFLDACGSQGEPGSPANDPAIGALCAKIKEITEVIPLGSAEMAWLLEGGAVNTAMLNFFASWIPGHNLPVNIELASKIIQLYAAGKAE